MKKRYAISVVVLAALVVWAAFTATAFAHPTQASACTGCHGSASSTVVSAVLQSNNGVTATYKVTVTSTGGGPVGWAVLSGSTNVARGTAASGTFSVPAGKTYTVWGADPNSGASSVSVSPAVPKDAHLSQPNVPASLTRNVLFTTTGFIDKAAATGPIKLLYYQLKAGKWVLYKTLPAKWSGYTAVTTKYLLNTTVPYAGSWRIGASYGGNSVYKAAYKFRDVVAK